MELAADNPQAEYLSSRVRWVHPSGYERTTGEPWAWPEFSRWMCGAHVGSMHRRTLYDRLGAYDTSYRIVADYELLLRARGQLKTAYMPVTTVMMRGGARANRSTQGLLLHSHLHASELAPVLLQQDTETESLLD